MSPGRVGAADLGLVHRFVRRTAADSRATILLLHGTGGDENDLISFGEAIAPDAALLSPRGGVLENGAPRFFQRLSEGRFDPAEVRARAAELSIFIRAASTEYRFPLSDVYALGYSNGANIASSLMFLEPGLLAGAMLFRPMVVIESDSGDDLGGTAVFIGAGRLDTVVPADHPERLSEMFRRRGAAVTLRWQVSGHNLTPQDIAEAARWFEMQMERKAATFSQQK